MSDVILIGKKKPKRIYRIVIQERISTKCKKEGARSFMIKDYVGNSDIDKIKHILKSNMTTEIRARKRVGRPKNV